LPAIRRPDTYQDWTFTSKYHEVAQADDDFSGHTHALLGAVELEDSLAKKDANTKMTRFYTQLIFFHESKR